MTTFNQAVFSFLLITLFTFSMPVFSNENIRVHHQLISHSAANDGTSVTLSLRIHNYSNIDYRNVKLMPTGDLFLVSEKNKSVNIGHLPSQGEAVIQWTANTPLEIDYFKSHMPVFFHLIAKNDENISVRVPLFSQGE